MPDVYDAPQLSGLGGIAIIRSGQPTEYRQAPSGVGGGGDLVDQAIQARQNYEARRNNLIQQLPYADRGHSRAIAAELHAMDFDQRERDMQAREGRIIAHQRAMQADHELKTDRDRLIDEHGAAWMQTMGSLENKLNRGAITEDQYHDALLESQARFGRYGSRHPEAWKHYNFLIEQETKQGEFQARRALVDAGKIAGKYGVDVQTDPETGLPSIPLTRAAAMQTPLGKQEALKSMDVEMFHKYGLHTGVSSLFNPVAPHTSPDNNKTIDIPFADPKTGTVAKVNVPMPLFNQMKSDFQDRYFAVTPQQAAAPTGTQATDPRTELAKRALDDPDATEAHKEAARKILGIQENAE